MVLNDTVVGVANFDLLTQILNGKVGNIFSQIFNSLEYFGGGYLGWTTLNLGFLTGSCFSIHFYYIRNFFVFFALRFQVIPSFLLITVDCREMKVHNSTLKTLGQFILFLEK
jgi:hypothetical protein